MRSQAEVSLVLTLAGRGLNNCQISRETGIPRVTVSNWVNGRQPRFERHAGGCARCGNCTFPVPSLLLTSYSYLLGLYLGDGMLSAHPRRVYRLRIYLDRRYPVIVHECAAAMDLVMPASRAGVYRHKRAKMDEVSSYSQHWPHLFPQHGPGLKHKRPIRLERWQQLVVARYPGRLVRGLIHSDGCRAINRVRGAGKVYSYPRYFFSNRSRDIQQIFTDACDQLGVSWRQDGPWNVSVARRHSVALLDRHIGPKR